jgi:hypothetical protein
MSSEIVSNANPPPTTAPGSVKSGNNGTPLTARKTLLSAWALFLDYDKESTQQKRQYVWWRRLVIYLGLLSSGLAVFYTYVSGSADVAVQQIATITQSALVILPIGIGILLHRMSRIAPKDWAIWRIVAELYRREIYLFRMNAGVYRDPTKRLENFAQQLKAIKSKIKNYGTPKMRGVTDHTKKSQGTPGSIAVDTDEIIYAQVQALAGKPAEDDGIATMTGQQYIDLRLKSQMDYYDRNAVKDVIADNRWSLASSIATALGALLALSSIFAPLVAITGALGITLGLLMNLRLIGKTNAIYRWAFDSLRHTEVEWNTIVESGQQDNPDRVADIVEEVENVFQSERETWMEQVIQSAESVENSLTEKYERLKTEVKSSS